MNSILSSVPFAEMLWGGFLTTVAVSLASILGSFLVGTLVALAVTFGSAVTRRCARIYMETFRNVPFLVLVFFFYFGLPELGVFVNSFWTGAIALSIAVGAYVADVLSAGLKNIRPQIIEAATVYGFNQVQRVRFFLLPLALRIALKPLGSIFVNLILTTSILSTITLTELTSAAKIVASKTFSPFEVYFLLLVLYSLLTHFCSLLVHLFHLRATRHIPDA